ncbi:MAG TPA: TetR/AcrR family transcriptional regulator [Caulobacteraceae bacterium]|jgi:AcrR family transcriptional regulator|nr:TetR/AcrR family transcriptional regulator [Caulobacteraceae bacterium]
MPEFKTDAPKRPARGRRAPELRERADEAGAGRRERKKAQTRALLEKAAIKLFSRYGYERVTVVDIAREADVDPTTFFRHFKSKESVLFWDSDEAISHFREEIAARPDDEPLLVTAVEALRALLRRLDEGQEAVRAEIVATTKAPEVAAYMLQFEERLRLELQQALAARMGVDPAKDARPYLLAAAVVGPAQWFRWTAGLGRRPRSTSTFDANVGPMLASVIPYFKEVDRLLK